MAQYRLAQDLVTTISTYSFLALNSPEARKHSWHKIYTLSKKLLHKYKKRKKILWKDFSMKVQIVGYWVLG